MEKKRYYTRFLVFMAFRVFLREKVITNLFLKTNHEVCYIVRFKMKRCILLYSLWYPFLQTIKFYFQVDVAVVEVGCGGEYDTTNIIRYTDLHFFSKEVFTQLDICKPNLFVVVLPKFDHLVFHCRKKASVPTMLNIAKKLILQYSQRLYCAGLKGASLTVYC